MVSAGPVYIVGMFLLSFCTYYRSVQWSFCTRRIVNADVLSSALFCPYCCLNISLSVCSYHHRLVHNIVSLYIMLSTYTLHCQLVNTLYYCLFVLYTVGMNISLSVCTYHGYYCRIEQLVHTIVGLYILLSA